MLLYNELPTFVKQSTTLTTLDKEKLCSIDHIPSELEVDKIRHLDSVQELTNAFIGDESTRNIHLQLKAKEFIDNGDIEMAWKIILLT